MAKLKGNKPLDRDYFKYKDAIQNDKDLKDVFPSDYPIKQLDLFRQTLEKEQERS